MKPTSAHSPESVAVDACPSKYGRSNTTNLSSKSTDTRNLFLPNGQRLTVLPVFGGFFFKSNDISLHSNVFPAGWTVILQTEYARSEDSSDESDEEIRGRQEKRTRHIFPYRQPTLQQDYLFISSISNPSSNDFQAPTSHVRQTAMMLWASLYWYFHQKEPSRLMCDEASKSTPESGKPQGEWRINIKSEGVLRGRGLVQKLERMGLVMSEDSSVGVKLSDNAIQDPVNLFTSRRAFWQLPMKLFIFTLSGPASIFVGSPYGSRPGSPVWGDHKNSTSTNRDSGELYFRHPSPGIISPFITGPSTNNEVHFLNYYPPAPLQYVITDGVRHPLRPKPPSQGEVFYSRYIPSVGQYLTFRTASLSEKPVTTNGPTSQASSHVFTPSHHANNSLPALSPLSSTHPHLNHVPFTLSGHFSNFSLDGSSLTPHVENTHPTKLTDLQLLHNWMNIPRVAKFWGCDGPISKQEAFLRKSLESRHSFPVIGLWDEKPFGYFEIYWAKEDILGRNIGDGSLGDWDRGFHVLVGENEFRGKNRVQCWLTALAHWAFTDDIRTGCTVLEPRIDNVKFISHLQDSGFLKEREVTFPHKQSALMKLRRDNFEAPVI